VSFDESATKIIDRLFTQYVNDDTLVITSSSEHPSVYNNLQKCKHVLKLFSVCGYNSTVHLEDEMKKFKNVFVYVIGLSSGDNFYCSNEWFSRLKSALLAMGKSHIFTIDAVQELFLLPRDYSMFDYVIGTAHAIIPSYDIGMVMSKNYIGTM
jgi:cysteine sulfinate desulfinase/cysteine desulfurase-like protein